MGLGSLVLQDVPVLGELAVLHAHDVSGDSGDRSAVAGETPVCDHIIAFSEDEVVFAFQRVRQRADKVEQAVSAGRHVSAVLDVAIRPKSFGVRDSESG